MRQVEAAAARLSAALDQLDSVLDQHGQTVPTAPSSGPDLCKLQEIETTLDSLIADIEAVLSETPSGGK